MLLEREGVNICQADTVYDRAPILWVAERGYEVVVKMPLRREEANSDHTEADYTRTLLSLAAASRNFGLVFLEPAE